MKAREDTLPTMTGAAVAGWLAGVGRLAFLGAVAGEVDAAGLAGAELGPVCERTPMVRAEAANAITPAIVHAHADPRRGKRGGTFRRIIR